MLAIVTVATRVERHMPAFLESCRRRGIEPLVLALGEPWRGFGWRLKRLHGALQGLRCPYVLMADAYDSILVRDADAILETFARLGHPLVASAETNCWPDAAKAEAYPPAPTRYRYLNAGGWIAERCYALTLFERLGVPRLADWVDDQRFLTDAFLADPSILRLDTRCELFQTLEGASGDLVYRDGIYNRETGTYPSVIHGNGPSEAGDVMRDALAWSGLAVCP